MKENFAGYNGKTEQVYQEETGTSTYKKDLQNNSKHPWHMAPVYMPIFKGKQQDERSIYAFAGKRQSSRLTGLWTRETVTMPFKIITK